MEPIEKAYAGLDKRLALLEQRLDIIQKNHLYHIQEDLNSIKKGVKWFIGVVFVQLIAVIGVLISNMPS